MATMKQSREEFLVNYEALKQSILPAKLAESQKNYNAFDEWFEDHCLTKEGQADVTVENLKACVAALYRANRLTWEIEPKKLGQEKQVHREQDPLGLRARHDALEANAKEKDRRDAESLIQRLRTWARTYTTHPHSRRDAIKAKLAAMFPASTSGWTLAQAEAFEKQLRVTADQMER